MHSGFRREANNGQDQRIEQTLSGLRQFRYQVPNGKTWAEASRRNATLYFLINGQIFINN